MNQSNDKSTIASLFDLQSLTIENVIRFGIQALNVFGLLLVIYALYWGFTNQIFTSEAALNQLLEGMGTTAPIAFIGIQIIQTVVPIIPGGLTIPAGVAIFGMGFGFVLNFIGIMIGSVINFGLARKFGRPLVELLISQRKFEKYTHWLEDESQFEKWFTFGMFFPLSPADLLCYIAGLSKLSFSKYFLILSLGKPITLFIYTVGITKFLELLFQVLA